MKVGQHARRRFVGDLDGTFQDPLGDNMSLDGSGGLGRHVHTITLVAANGCSLQLLFKGSKPFLDKMDVLQIKNTVKMHQTHQQAGKQTCDTNFNSYN